MGDLVTRFSPAPTGLLHVGSARTALFLWLLARGSGGTLRLRVEDTNAELYRPEFLESILDTVTWLGIDFDDEPVYQSRRADRYRELTEQLLAGAHAYYCECTTEEVQRRTKGNATPGYDSHCRERGLGPGPGRMVRFRVPDDGATAFTDVIKGEITVEHRTIEDFPIQRSNGSATFFLPNAIDDVDMGITHVVRGDDLINVTPRVLLIRRALGNDDVPVFAHLPMLVDEQRKKLSKRRDDEEVVVLRERGYLPEAVRNYLALLGWGPRDGVEIRPIEEIRDMFRLEDVTASPAFFDLKKLDHINAEYIRSLPTDEFIERVRPFFDEANPALPTMAEHVQTRVKTLAEVPGMLGFLAVSDEDLEIDEQSWGKATAMGVDAAGRILDQAIAAYGTCPWQASSLHETTLELAEAEGLALGKAQAPIRVAVTGSHVGPPLFESLEVLGREHTLNRLRRARARLGP